MKQHLKSYISFQLHDDVLFVLTAFDFRKLSALSLVKLFCYVSRYMCPAASVKTVVFVFLVLCDPDHDKQQLCNLIH